MSAPQLPVLDDAQQPRRIGVVKDGLMFSWHGLAFRRNYQSTDCRGVLQPRVGTALEDGRS